MNSRRRPEGQRPICGLDHSSPDETAPADETRKTSSDRSTAAFDARVREDSRASTPAAVGDVPPDTHTSSLQVARAGQADDGRGSNAKDPSEQPGTSAPELLPDREANVNGIAEGKALGP